MPSFASCLLNARGDAFAIAQLVASVAEILKQSGHGPFSRATRRGGQGFLE